MKALKTKFDEMCAKIYTRFDLSRTKAAEVIKNDEGAVATEYALVVAVVVMGIVIAAKTMTGPLEIFFADVVAKVHEMLG